MSLPGEPTPSFNDLKAISDQSKYAMHRKDKRELIVCYDLATKEAKSMMFQLERDLMKSECGANIPQANGRD
eukprot:3433098-Amphidinium_carterae.1